MNLQLITAPVIEPVDLAEVRDWCRIEGEQDDGLLVSLLRSCRQLCEGFTRRALLTQTWELGLPCFPPVIDLPMPPLQSVSSITYTDIDGASQTLSPSLYQVDTRSTPGRIAPAYQQTWPSLRSGVFNPVVVRFVAGWTDVGQVPEDIRTGILSAIGRYYDHREDVIAGTIVATIPGASKALWQPHQVELF